MFEQLKKLCRSEESLSTLLALHSIQHRKHEHNLRKLRKLSKEVIELKLQLDEKIEDLRKSEKMFRLAAEAGNDFIYVYDEETGRITWYDSPQELLGISNTSISVSTPEGWARFIHEEDREGYLKEVRDRQTGKKSFQRYRVRVGNSCRYFSDRALAVNGDIDSSKWVGAITDYTDIAENEFKFRALSEAGFESIIIHRDFEVVALNNSFTELTGYTFKDAIEADDFLKTLIHPDCVEEVSKRIETDNTSSYRTTITTKSGEEKDVWVRIKYVSFNGYGLCRASSLTEWIDRA